MKKSLMVCISFALLNLGCSSSDVGSNSVINSASYIYSTQFACDPLPNQGDSCIVGIDSETVDKDKITLTVNSVSNCTYESNTVKWFYFNCPVGTVAFTAPTKPNKEARFFYRFSSGNTKRLLKYVMVSALVPAKHFAKVTEVTGGKFVAAFGYPKSSCPQLDMGSSIQNSSTSGCKYMIVIDPLVSTDSASNNYSYNFSAKYWHQNTKF